MDDFTTPDDGREHAFAAENETSGKSSGEDAKHLYQIGEVAREFGFTLRALRFYEEKGLVSPVRTGMRRLYSARDRRRLEIIAQCKRVGLALEEIRMILRAADQPNGERRQLETALELFLERIEIIKAEEEHLRESMREAQKLIREVRDRIDRLGQ